MKYSFSLESVNMLTSGPNFIYKQSKSFWVNYFKYISAAGFQAVELPFNPFSSDPMAFETGRCGIPLSATAIRAKYGSPEEFLKFLQSVGIQEISSVHVNANDAMLEAVATQVPPVKYYEFFEKMSREALAHCDSLKCRTLIISPSPELGWLKELLSEDLGGEFAKRTAVILNKLRAESEQLGIQIALRSEFWSFFREHELDSLVTETGLKYCFDPAHMYISGMNIIEAVKANGNAMACPRLTDTDFIDNYGNYERINAEIPVEGPQKVFADLGDGNVELLAYAQELKNAGYEGYVVCEQRKTLDVYRGLLKLRWYLDHEISAELR